MATLNGLPRPGLLVGSLQPDPRASALRRRLAAIAAALLCGSGGAGFAGVCAAALPNGGTTLVFGGDAAYPPFEWVDASGKAQGLYVDLARAIASEGGVTTVQRLGQWPDAVRSLESGSVDAVAMFRSEDREKRFLFTPVFLFVSHDIYGRREAPNVVSLEDLSGRRVAVEELSFAHQQLADGRLAVRLVLTSSTVAALRAVERGQADYAVLAGPPADYLIRQRNMAVRKLGPPLWPRGYAFAVRKDRVLLANWLTQNFNRIVKSGAYEDVYARWANVGDPSVATAEPRSLEIVLIALSALTVLGLAWACRLQRTVARNADVLLVESERRCAAESRVRWAADHDAYTELPRLHHFCDRVQGLLEAPSAEADSPLQVAALKLADLDRAIRTRGHQAALGVTRDFAVRLSALNLDACGQSRDVFLVFGRRRDIESKLRARNPHAQASARTYPQNPGGGAPQIFAGCATWPKDGRDVFELLRHAETALAVAVARRDAWVEYRPSMEPDEADLELLDLFRRSGGADIYPVFQPQIDLRSGDIVGAEALARWNPLRAGPVPPAKFVPLLEDAGLIGRVTDRMLCEAVRVATALRSAGSPCPISVNVSVSDLLDESIMQALFEVLRAQNAAAADLKLELTETGVTERPEIIGSVIARLRGNGIAVSVDDFGTAYSSLSYLSNFPIQEVKIDRSFVAAMTSKPRDRSIVRSTIAMAHELGLVVVAEGVETDIQAELLRQDGCDRAQGYLYSRPLVEADLVEALSRHRRAPMNATAANSAER